MRLDLSVITYYHLSTVH